MSSDSSQYEDDLSILDDAELWRRIPHWHIVKDGNQGGNRISSAAFDNHPNGTPMSVVLGRMVIDAGRSPNSVIAGLDGFYLASVTAELVRSLDQIVVSDSLDEEPAHAVVVGKKSKGVKKKLAKNATWIISPEE